MAWSWFCTVNVAHVGHVSALSPRRKAQGVPALVRFARARPGGRAVEACVLGQAVEARVIGLAVEAHVARGQLNISCPLSYFLGASNLYHMAGHA